MEHFDPEDLQKNLGVLITYTIAKYSTKKQQEKGIPAACSLNIKELIVLTEELANYNIALEDFVDPEPAGLNLSHLAPISSFSKSIPGPSQKGIKEQKRLADMAKERIRA